MENPFEELGLEAETVLRLDDKRLKQLVFHQISAATARYHPDKITKDSKKLKKFEAIRLMLDDPKEFNKYKEEFIQSHREIDFDMQKMLTTQSLYNRANWTLQQILEFVQPSKNSAFHIGDKFFEMKDVHGESYILHIAANGTFSKQYEDETIRLPLNRVIGTIPEVCEKHGNIEELLRCLLKPSDCIRLTTTSELLSNRYGYGFGQYSFDAFLELVRPVIETNGLLASLYIGNIGRPKYFALEGIVQSEIIKSLEMEGDDDDYKNAKRIIAYFVSGKRELRKYSDKNVVGFAELLKTKNGDVSKQKIGRLRNKLVNSLKIESTKEEYARAFNYLVDYIKKVEESNFEYGGLISNG